MGGSDGNLYELVYGRGEAFQFFGGKDCKLVSITGLFISFLPQLYPFSTDPIDKVVVDKEKNILYFI